jgi:hypothetical protein
MPSYSGVWTLPAQYQAIGSTNWPMGPGAPTSVTASAGDASASVTFVAPTFTGIPPGITGYLATSSPGGLTATGASSPLSVTGLSNGTAYTFAVQATNGVQYGPAGTSGSVTPAAPRGVFAGGETNVDVCTMDYITISSTGNATSFGNLSSAKKGLAGCASSTRGLFGGGNPAGILYITIATTGNTTSFGGLTYAGTYANNIAACNSATRGIFAGGTTQLSAGDPVNIIDYVTIDTTGGSTTFGSMTTTQYFFAGCSSSTRGIFSGGSDNLSAIQYITIATTGNATSFGTMATGTSRGAALSSSTRGVFMGGENDVGSRRNLMQYVTIATTGNTTTFGNLAATNSDAAGVSSSTRGVYGGGIGPSGNTNLMSYITIATTGNGATFGQLTVARAFLAGCSSTNGGTQ